MRVCLDLTPNEMRDRHGGFGRYGFQLLQSMVALPAGEKRGLELFALPWSSRPPVPAEEALGLKRRVLERPAIPPWIHRTQRRLLTGPLLRRQGVRLFHSLHPGALPLLPGCRVVATCHDIIPVVMPDPGHGHGHGLMRTLRQGYSWVQHLLRHRRPDHLIAISEATRQDVIRLLRVPGERISVIHHGIDLERFAPEPDPDERQAVQERHRLPPRWFIYVGSDHFRKNHHRLFEAWCGAAAEIPEGLVFVGRALYAQTLQQIEAQVRARGLSERFRWLHEIGDAELPALYRNATAAVVPSEYEGFGMTLLESMACGTPVAASKVASHPEVGGDAALYFDPRDVEGLREQMLRLSRDVDLRQELRERGLKRARRFTWRAAAEATLALYVRLLAR